MILSLPQLHEIPFDRDADFSHAEVAEALVRIEPSSITYNVIRSRFFGFASLSDSTRILVTNMYGKRESLTTHIYTAWKQVPLFAATFKRDGRVPTPLGLDDYFKAVLDRDPYGIADSWIQALMDSKFSNPFKSMALIASAIENDVLPSVAAKAAIAQLRAPRVADLRSDTLKSSVLRLGAAVADTIGLRQDGDHLRAQVTRHSLLCKLLAEELKNFGGTFTVEDFLK